MTQLTSLHLMYSQQQFLLTEHVELFNRTVCNSLSISRCGLLFREFNQYVVVFTFVFFMICTYYFIRPTDRSTDSLTSSEVDEHIQEKNGVGTDVEDDPARTEIVVEERYCHRKDDQVDHQ